MRFIEVGFFFSPHFTTPRKSYIIAVLCDCFFVSLWININLLVNKAYILGSPKLGLLAHTHSRSSRLSFNGYRLFIFYKSIISIITILLVNRILHSNIISLDAKVKVFNSIVKLSLTFEVGVLPVDQNQFSFMYSLSRCSYVVECYWHLALKKAYNGLIFLKWIK